MWGATFTLFAIVQYSVFQPTRPVWGATKILSQSAKDGGLFQPTRPVWGATRNQRDGGLATLVSTHAPRVGRDLIRLSFFGGSSGFQPTRPVWGATFLGCSAVAFLLRFQPTRPVWGATLWHLPPTARDTFQPTRPVWGATGHAERRRDETRVSTHAPRVGRDSILPAGWLRLVVSTHAPRVGRDARHRKRNSARHRFQPTRPVWGATVCVDSIYIYGTCNAVFANLKEK